jgi:hypothetical protein
MSAPGAVPGPEEIKARFDALPVDQQKEVAAYAVQALKPATQPTTDTLWLIVVSAFTALMLGGVLLVFVLILEGHDTSVILPFVSAALGVLAGLLAPSPVTNSP